MLLQFLAQNYLSIRDEVILSLEPSADLEHPENILTNGKYKAEGMIAIYGANASGKTALFKAMTIALNILRQSNIRQINDVIPVVPFKFDEELMGKSIYMVILQTCIRFTKSIYIDIIRIGRDWCLTVREQNTSFPELRKKCSIRLFA